MVKSLFCWLGFSFVLITLNAPWAEARRRPATEGSEIFESVRESMTESNLGEAQKVLEKEISKAVSSPIKDLILFKLGYVYFLQGQHDKSLSTLKSFLELKSKLQDYGHYYLAKNYLKLGKDKEAEEELRKIEKMSPNVKLRNDSELELSILNLRQKRFHEARAHLVKLEKRARGTDAYSEVIYQLSLAERGLQNQSKSCRWLRKLYEKYPAYTYVKNWGPDLYENQLEGKPTRCKTGVDNFKTRIRFLMWMGLDERAQSEINTVKARIGRDNKYLADELQVQFYLQEGEPHKALEILKPYYAQRKKDFSFLILYATVSARAGEMQPAVGSYYEAYKQNPRARQSKQALYQSAFLSYQFQDYDGAGRRFREFLKVYPRSGLTRDAEWHLAWLQYLKGDFQGAFEAMSKLRKKRVSKKAKSREDRIEYWRAMSLFRMGKLGEAKSIFEGLSKDPLYGYYAIAAAQRLKKIGNTVATVEDTSAAPPAMADIPRRMTRFSWDEFIITSPFETKVFTSQGEESENEESVSLTAVSSADDETEETEAENGGDAGTSEVASAEENFVTEFKSPDLLLRFEKARDLMMVGMDDWAKWDLYEIERRTKNKDYLRTLMAEYSSVEHYHRSSYLSQVVFSPIRASQGIEGNKSLWEFAYPKAYSAEVEKSSKEFKVPTDLIWGIMKAESQYRKDAISPVGALGLMQVMPYTGRRVASLLSDGDFKASQLLEPPVAIRIGSRYLQRLLQKFDQAIPFVAAAYNAGPHRVGSWLAYFGTRDMDEFVEHIPFVETRNYVKRVVSNSYIYGRLYGPEGDKDGAISLSEPIKMKTEPSFRTKESWDDI